MFLHEVDKDVLGRMVMVNCHSAVQMTRLVVPRMVEQKRGAIINIASIAGTTPSALLATYSASKAFLRFFSESTRDEYARKGITVQCVNPGLVVTKLSKVKRPSLFAPMPRTFVRQALRTVGYFHVTPGYWSHALQSWLLSVLPFGIARKMLFGLHAGLRKRALRHKKKG